MSAGKKTCPKCGAEKPLEDFHRNTRTKDGLMSRCRSCHNAANSASQRKHREKRREYQRKWQAENRERLNEAQRLWREANPGRYAESAKRWREANAERVAELNREYAKTRVRTPEEIARCNHRRRARLRDAFVEDFELEDLILRDEGRCGICGEDLEGPDFHIDHIVPLAAGGRHEPNNVQLAHPLCNVRKGAKVEEALRPAA